jgi:tetratricopeptide (TPR) repeat protein
MLRFLRLGALTVLIALVVAESIPLLTTMKIRQSQDAVAAGNLTEALDDAQGARSLQPWAASPYLQIALVYEQAGDVDAALRAIRSALSHDSSDWRLWIVATRLETKAGDIAAARESLARARELNPRSPLFRTS